MKLNEVLARIQEGGAKISGREPSPDGNGWILYIGRLSELIYPFATIHCIPIHVAHLENPELHPEEEKAVLRRFSARGEKKKGPAKA
jgi:hypothetical protein